MIDARGYSCPEPVLLCKEATDRGDKNIEIQVDALCSRENVERFLISQGYTVKVEEMGEEEWTLRASK